MSRLIVEGGHRLEGEMEIQGAKNAALPILAAALLTDKTVTITDFPDITDVHNMLYILEHIGCHIVRKDSTLSINSADADKWEMPDFLAKEIRSSIFMLGPMIGRFRRAKFTYPGGCEIGARPIDLHLNGLKALSVNIREAGGHIYCEGYQLKGAEVQLDYPSVGATENIMMAAVKAEGETTIHNAAREPEVYELQQFINAMGGRVEGAGSSTIVIKGVKKLSGVSYCCLPDRIAAGTYLVAAGVCGGDLTLKNVVPEHLFSVMQKLKEAGMKIFTYSDVIRIKSEQRLNEMHLIETAPYPGFPTDMQAQMCAAASIAKGTSIIIENVFDNRFKHINELVRMGANITVKNKIAIIRGVDTLAGAQVSAMDLRAGAALVIAGLAAQGKSVISHAEIIDRGYERIEEALGSVGAKISREED